MRVPLVLLPGLSCDHAVWQGIVARLEDVDCLVPDVPARDDLGAMAEELLRTLPPSFALAGHSMGGRIALEIVRRQPARISHLALLDTGFQALPEGDAGEAERTHRHALLALAREQGMRAMGRRWSEPMVHPSRLADRALMDAILDMIARSTPDRFAREIRALLARPDASDMLGAIRCPALVACGGDDVWAPVGQHREIAGRIAGSRLVVFEACGHMAPMERPREVARSLRDLLSAAPRVRTSERRAA